LPRLLQQAQAAKALLGHPAHARKLYFLFFYFFLRNGRLSALSQCNIIISLGASNRMMDVMADQAAFCDAGEFEHSGK
jgi:hypothetical protein